MAIIRCPITRREYDLPDGIVRQLHRTAEERGPEWLAQQLRNFLPRTIPGQNNTVDLDDLIFEAPPRVKKVKRVEAEEPVATLPTPIIPETNEDGTKKLYKTRYAELEKMYATLHSQNQRLSRQHRSAVEENEKYKRQLYDLTGQLEEAKRLTVDGEKMKKRISQVCKEAQIVLPEYPYGETMDKVLQSFLGAILCRIRTEVVNDELAD